MKLSPECRYTTWQGWAKWRSLLHSRVAAMFWQILGQLPGGRHPTRTTPHQGHFPPGQFPTKTTLHQENSPIGQLPPPEQFPSRTTPHQDKSPLGLFPARITPHNDNSPLGQFPHQDNFPPSWDNSMSWWWVVWAEVIGGKLSNRPVYEHIHIYGCFFPRDIVTNYSINL